ncbi:MAG: hypothetical protein FJY65_09675 [Calditrichaeota bacterium]|nr:hypothetical protein [Calditrichota bacterium]
MNTKCRCGSRCFKALGIQSSWAGRNTGRAPRVLYLAVCSECGTTLSINRLHYALLRSRESETTFNLAFYTTRRTAAA